MDIKLTAVNAPQAWYNLLFNLRHGKVEETRAGKVKAIQGISVVTVLNPDERIVFAPQRDANPFFHVMETVWMLAGRRDVGWLEFYNKRMREFAEDDGNINGTYGYRWRQHWRVDQIERVIEMLRIEPTTRQAVLAMWDPDEDMWGRRDQPCNTHIYFRYIRDRLDMTVLNRSNDLVWGMMGANIVHLTYLHELVARAAGLPLGRYHVVSNNLHIYERHWPLLDSPQLVDPYEERPRLTPLAMLGRYEVYKELLADCMKIVDGDLLTLKTAWANTVARPLHMAWEAHKNQQKELALNIVEQIYAEDIREAARQWLTRRYKQG